jgi:hypothetical protein
MKLLKIQVGDCHRQYNAGMKGILLRFSDQQNRKADGSYFRLTISDTGNHR